MLWTTRMNTQKTCSIIAFVDTWYIIKKTLLYFLFDSYETQCCTYGSLNSVLIIVGNCSLHYHHQAINHINTYLFSFGPSGNHIQEILNQNTIIFLQVITYNIFPNWKLRYALHNKTATFTQNIPKYNYICAQILKTPIDILKYVSVAVLVVIPMWDGLDQSSVVLPLLMVILIHISDIIGQAELRIV